MTPEQRKHWEAMLEHQQAVTKASHFWAELVPRDEHTATWSHLNEAANTMLHEMCVYADRCKRENER
jgi:hypothetical protein